MSNICERCGKQKALYINMYTNGFLSAVHAATTPSTMKICMCPPPKEKHDGKLEPMVMPSGYHDDTAYVDIELVNKQTLVHFSGGYTVGYVVEEPDIYLDPQQALSLLAWLKQKQGTLERLAQEEE